MGDYGTHRKTIIAVPERELEPAQVPAAEPVAAPEPEPVPA